MTYTQLQARATALCDIWGYSNTLIAPDWPTLVNYAMRDFLWDAEAIHGPTGTFNTVKDQAEYTLPTPEWKTILDCYYGTDRQIRLTGEGFIRRQDPMWLMRGSSTPVYGWQPRPDTFRLHPTPDTSSIVVTLYGIRAPANMTTGTDIPACEPRYHEAIAIRAAYLHAKNYAKGEAREVLAARDSEYQDYVVQAKNDNLENEVDDFRYVYPVEADRLFI